MNAPERVWIDTTGNKNTGPNWPTKPVWAATEYIRADLYDAQAAEIADLRRQLAEARKVKPLEWVKGIHETRDDDGGPREGILRRLWAWRASGYLIIQQDGDGGLFILKGKSDGIGLVVPTLEAAKAAAQADASCQP